MTTQLYTPAEKAITKDVINKYGNRGAFDINPGDPLLVSFYDIQLRLAGLDPSTAPQFIRCWQQARRLGRSTGRLSQAAGNGANPVYSIAGIDSTDGQSWRADAIGSLPVDATNVTQTLGLFDGDATNVGAVNQSRTYLKAADCTISAKGTYPDSQKIRISRYGNLYLCASYR